MISCLILERPGAWRIIGITTLLLIAVLPAVPLAWSAFISLASAPVLVGSAFRSALVNSVFLALGVAVVSLVIGLPLGVLTALYAFPGRSLWFMVVTLPLLAPSFLWAIGWASLAVHLDPSIAAMLTGFPGCLLVLSSEGIPLVLLVSHVATRSLSGSQVDAVRLAAGEGRVVCTVARYVAPPALLMAGLGGVLTLSDPGPGQIFGLATVASEVLTSFSARYDFALAGRQCLAMTLFALVSAAPLAFVLAPRLASAVMVQQSGPVQRLRHRGIARTTVVALAVCGIIGTLTPLMGLTLPLIGGTAFGRAWGELARTVGDTLVYAAGAGAIATLVGFLLAVCAGRNDRFRMLCLGMSLVLVSLPPTVTALGLVRLATGSPAWTDPLLRSRFTVCVALGLRFLPVAVVLGLRAWGSTSPTWTLAASLHGVSLMTYFRWVVFPVLLPTGVVTMVLVALLATADVSTVLLLHPPGERSLPLAVFTIMANAPESLIASLCLIYVGGAAGLLTAVWTLAGRQQT